MTSVQIIGGGKMGEALLTGLRAAGHTVRVVETHGPRADQLRAAHPDLDVSDTPSDAEGTVIAVKPQDVRDATEASVAAGTARILSIAAGVTLATLESVALDRPVVRAMPNTPALVGMGASAIAAGRHAGEEDLVWAETVLGAVGIVERVPEPLLDAVTGLSGSGPAYVFLLAEALVEAGVLNGLPRPTATSLVHQTLLGAATLLTESDRGAAALRGDVTSPGGTTAAGLARLEDHGVRAAVLDAVTAATERARELGA